jgi:DNA-binding CsgD family transcriptional regulator
MELAYAGLHQLCAPFLDRIADLPEPQQDALAVAFGLRAGDAPDRFLVGLAVLNLLAEVAEDQPLVCLIDDAQWLDRMSSVIVAFVARRLLAERIALVVALREPAGETDFDGLPYLAVTGLSDADAGRLLDSVVAGPIDPRVRERIISETRGNPLALLELPRAWTTAELVAGLGRPDETPLAGRIEEGFARRLQALPAPSRRLLLIAAAEPLGDPILLWRAAETLGLTADAAVPAEAAGLIEFGPRIRFRHPLVRAAAYRSAAAAERRRVHRALADATDGALDPDRRAWHRAHATGAPDEAIAAELERAAEGTRGRGGRIAAAAMLERAAGLTPDPGRRAGRALAAAWLKRDAGALDAALALLTDVAAGPPDPLREAEVEHLRGQIAFDRRHGQEAAGLLLDAARRLEPLDTDLARETYLDALAAAIWASGGDAPDAVVAVAKAARSAVPAREPARPVDVVLDALARRFTDGHEAAAPLLGRALDTVMAIEAGSEHAGRLLRLGGNRVSAIIATEVWDFDSGHALAARQVQLARDTGALVQLQFALNVLATNELLRGRMADGTALIEEDRLVAEVTGNPPVGYAAVLLAALRGDEDVAAAVIAAARGEAESLGQGRIVTFADYASAVLNNGLGRHDLARDAARRVFERDVVGGYQTLATAELGEAASRTGDDALLAAAVDRLAARARAAPTDWSIGLASRLRALAGDGDEAERCYQESIARLGRLGVQVEVARGHLLYGEWLRRIGRRVDARDQLRRAHDLFIGIGLAAFAERARRELLATGEKARKRTVETAEELTAQEFQIARLAREGFSNPEIGTRLFLSPRTVEWHLRKVFTKLEITSRKQLRDAELDAAPA